MGRGKKYQPEQVVNLLRQIEVAAANGKTTALACKEAGIVEHPRLRCEFLRAPCLLCSRIHSLSRARVSDLCLVDDRDAIRVPARNTLYYLGSLRRKLHGSAQGLRIPREPF